MPICCSLVENTYFIIYPCCEFLLLFRNYSIYLDEDTNILYAYQELEGEGGSQDLGDTDICKKWWAYMADIMETNPDNSPVSIPLPEMFHMD